MALCKAVTVFLLSSLSWTLTTSVCPEEYKQNGDDCFLISPHLLENWSQAKNYCERFSGRLVQIDSEGKNMELKNFLKTDGKCNQPTTHGKTCLGFTYKGVTYNQGECAFQDSTLQCPWCATDVATNGEYNGSPGEGNWDYCSDSCCDMFKNFWIGLHKPVESQTFIWQGTNATATYFDWAPSSNGGSGGGISGQTGPGDECALMDSKLDIGLRWRLNNCHAHGAVALCEPMNPSSTSSSSSSSSFSSPGAAFPQPPPSSSSGSFSQPPSGSSLGGVIPLSPFGPGFPPPPAGAPSGFPQGAVRTPAVSGLAPVADPYAAARDSTDEADLSAADSSADDKEAAAAGGGGVGKGEASVHGAEGILRAQKVREGPALTPFRFMASN